MAIFRYLQDGDRPSLHAHVWTSHEEYLVVFISVQNFVEIDAVVQMLIFNEFGLKTPIHAPKMEVLGILAARSPVKIVPSHGGSEPPFNT